MKVLVIVVLILAPLVGSSQESQVATLRTAPLDVEAPPPLIGRELNTDERRVRNYPEQPPIIPHKTEGYQIDLNANRCLACHSRHRIEESGAPMVSVTHYMDRDMQVLAEVSPRRYFCLQCHVSQTDANTLVENDFEDVRQIIEREGK